MQISIKNNSTLQLYSFFSASKQSKRWCEKFVIHRHISLYIYIIIIIFNVFEHSTIKFMQKQKKQDQPDLSSIKNKRDIAISKFYCSMYVCMHTCMHAYIQYIQYIHTYYTHTLTTITTSLEVKFHFLRFHINRILPMTFQTALGRDRQIFR